MNVFFCFFFVVAESGDRCVGKEAALGRHRMLPNCCMSTRLGHPDSVYYPPFLFRLESTKFSVLLLLVFFSSVNSFLSPNLPYIFFFAQSGPIMCFLPVDFFLLFLFLSSYFPLFFFTFSLIFRPPVLSVLLLMSVFFACFLLLHFSCFPFFNLNRGIFFFSTFSRCLLPCTQDYIPI